MLTCVNVCEYHQKTVCETPTNATNAIVPTIIAIKFVEEGFGSQYFNFSFVRNLNYDIMTGIIQQNACLRGEPVKRNDKGEATRRNLISS